MILNKNRTKVTATGSFDNRSFNTVTNKDLLDRFCHNFDRIPSWEIDNLLDKYNCL